MKSLRDWESEIDKSIREAMEQGKFDNLPGKGKPQDLSVNPHMDSADEAAFQMLQDAGYAPDWIEDDKALRAETEKARAALARAWAYRRERLAAMASQAGPEADAERARLEDSWQRAQSNFAEQVAALNRRIRDYNLKAPSSSLHRLLLRVDEEIRRAQETQAAAQEKPNEEKHLADGVRQIVSTRERTPRSPRWDAAWKRTLFRFNERLRELRKRQS
ncbi:MAG: DUF1992 domain-containing protein [Anaerolineae bacterium]|nr:DUF1992 domain-containing protein [Anaerolineae bacterium]